MSIIFDLFGSQALLFLVSLVSPLPSPITTSPLSVNPGTFNKLSSFYFHTHHLSSPFFYNVFWWLLNGPTYTHKMQHYLHLYLNLCGPSHSFVTHCNFKIFCLYKWFQFISVIPSCIRRLMVINYKSSPSSQRSPLTR